MSEIESSSEIESLGTEVNIQTPKIRVKMFNNTALFYSDADELEGVDLKNGQPQLPDSVELRHMPPLKVESDIPGRHPVLLGQLSNKLLDYALQSDEARDELIDQMLFELDIRRGTKAHNTIFRHFEDCLEQRREMLNPTASPEPKQADMFADEPFSDMTEPTEKPPTPDVPATNPGFSGTPKPISQIVKDVYRNYTRFKNADQGVVGGLNKASGMTAKVGSVALGFGVTAITALMVGPLAIPLGIYAGYKSFKHLPHIMENVVSSGLGVIGAGSIAVADTTVKVVQGVSWALKKLKNTRDVESVTEASPPKNSI